MIYKCPKCGGQVKEGVRFCKSCGQEFKWPQVTEPNFNAEKSSKNTSISTTPGDVEAMSNDVASTIVSNVVNQETNEMVSVKVRHRREISRTLLAKILIFVAFLSGESVTIYLLDGSENEWVLWIEIILNIIILLVNLLALFGNKIDSKVKKVVIIVSLLFCTANIIYSVTKISSILFVVANIFMLKTNANKKSNSENNDLIVKDIASTKSIVLTTILVTGAIVVSGLILFSLSITGYHNNSNVKSTDDLTSAIDGYSSNKNYSSYYSSGGNSYSSSSKTAVCNYCHGSGYANGEKCPWCGGSGRTYDNYFNDALK